MPSTDFEFQTPSQISYLRFRVPTFLGNIGEDLGEERQSDLEEYQTKHDPVAGVDLGTERLFQTEK